jgi:hypothetical protein
MPTTRRTLTVIVLLAAVAVVVFAGVWGFLSRFHTPYANWLTVETPRQAVIGQALDVRVRITKASQPSVLAVSVYVLGWNLAPVGRLPGLRPPVSVRAGDRYDFKVNVAPVDKMAYLQLVLWLSPDGDWNARSAGASTQAIPVRQATPQSGGEEFRTLRAYANPRATNPDAPFVPGIRQKEPEVYPASSAPFRMALAALLVSAGFVLFLGPARPGPEGSEGGKAGKVRLLWTALAVTLLCLALSEIFLFEGRLADWGRRLILSLDVYNFRQSYQKAGMALAAAAVAALVLLAVLALARRSDLAKLALAATAAAAYLALALAGALSFHYVDVLRSRSLGGISPLDVVKAALAIALLGLGLRDLRAGRAPEGKKRVLEKSKKEGGE